MHSASGLQWTLSSSLDSDYIFQKDADKFYSPADVTQLPNGNVLMIDNGANLNDDMPEGGTAIIVVERITQIGEGMYRTCIKMVVRNYPQVGKPQLLTMDEFRAYKQKREESIGLSSSIVLFTL